MADEEGSHAPVSQGAHDPPALQNPPPPQNPNNPIILNASQAPEALHLPTPHMTTLKLVLFLSQNIRVNQIKMQKLTYLGRTTGWTHGF